jgi:hypothetical protein
MNSGNFTVHHPPTLTRIPLNSRQLPSTIDLILSNGLHAVPNIATMTALSSDHEVPDFFIFDYKNANWSLFRQIFDENLNLDLSLDLMRTELDLDVMARSRSVPVVCPTRFALTLIPHIKSIIRLKNSQRHRVQRARLSRNSGATLSSTC